MVVFSSNPRIRRSNDIVGIILIIICLPYGKYRTQAMIKKREPKLQDATLNSIPTVVPKKNNEEAKSSILKKNGEEKETEEFFFFCLAWIESCLCL